MPRINSYSCVVVLILLWGLWLRELRGQSGEDAQRFFLRLRKNQDGDIVLTLENCEQATCLGGAKTNLQCMCEDEFQEAELLRQQCGSNGRNETGVQMLEQNNMPEILGICARAFANLGYVIDVVNINESDGRANDTESYTTEQLDETIFKLENYAADFWKLLDRTLVGVYLSSNQQRSTCKVCVSGVYCGYYFHFLCCVHYVSHSGHPSNGDTSINRTHLTVPNTLFGILHPLKSGHLTNEDTFFCRPD